MPQYVYRAISSDKEQIGGTATASTKDDLALELKKQGLVPLSIKESKKASKIGKLPIVEKITFCRYLATMLNSGLSLTESISVLAEEASHPVTKKILEDLRYGVNHGQTLSSVFNHFPTVFDSFFLTLVKSGEISGTLAETFEQIQEEVRAEHSLNQKIQSALLYPGVVFTAMLGIGVLMTFFILPQIGTVFLNLGLPLNPVTLTMFKVTIAMSKVKYYIMSGAVVVVILLALFLRTYLGKKVAMAMITPFPVIKNLIKKIDMARFCRVFSTLLKSGVPITQALEIALQSLSFSAFKKNSQDIADKVYKGQTLAVAFKDSNTFPSLLIQMIAAGEKSGTLDSTLADLASFYEEEVANGVKKLTELLEPILMLGVGFGVGVMILAVITPIYSVVSNLQAGP